MLRSTLRLRLAIRRSSMPCSMHAPAAGPSTSGQPTVQPLDHDDPRDVIEHVSMTSLGHGSDRRDQGSLHEAVARAVKEKMDKRGVSVILPGFYPPPENSVVDCLASMGVQQYRIRDVCCANPDLLRAPLADFRAVMDFLESLELLLSQRLDVISLCPEILREPDLQRMEYAVECLRSVQVRGKVLKQLVRRCPQVLVDDDPERFRVLVNNLLSFFSKKQILKVLYIHAPIIFADFADLERKYEYIYYRMGIEPAGFVRTAWYKRDLDFIKMRHECVVRSGVYQQPHEKRPTIALNNPELAKVIDSPRVEFASRVAGISVEEYDSFKAMYKRQQRLRDFEEVDEWDEEFDEEEWEE